MSAAALIANLASPASGLAGIVVNPGFDLLHTEAGTTFAGVPFAGVPLGTFDFGGGPLATGNADTIVHRLAIADAPSEAISIELVALHLRSGVPTNFGLGVGTYFVTLQSERGGPASVGRMTINFGPEGSPHGTFDSFFDVFFDIRLGALDGPIALSDHLVQTAQGVPWNHLPPPGAVEIPGVNTLLNGSDRLADFFPVGTFTEDFPGSPHVVTTATDGAVPEPSTLLMGTVFSVLSLLGYEWNRRQRAA
jgi:hypothetical protein